MTDLREELARAIACALDEAEEGRPPERPEDMELVWSYIDQGEVDFRNVANRILPIIERERAAERAKIVAWLRNRALPFHCTADRRIADAIEAGEHEG